MQVCPHCNKPILDNIEFCPICGSRVNVEKVKKAGTVHMTETSEDVTATLEKIKDWWRSRMVFFFSCLVCLVLAIIAILLDRPIWVTILCFIAAVFFIAMLVYSHVKISNLKRRLRGR